MGRLYYDKTASGEAEEYGKPTILLDGAAPKRGLKTVDEDAGETNQAKEYLEKIAALIPAEVVAAYMTITGMIPGIDGQPMRDLALGITFILCMVLTPFYFLKMREKDRPYKMHILLSSIAFVFWAYRVSGDMAFEGAYYNSTFASILLVLFTLVSGVIPLRK